MKTMTGLEKWRGSGHFVDAILSSEIIHAIDTQKPLPPRIASLLEDGLITRTKDTITLEAGWGVFTASIDESVVVLDEFDNYYLLPYKYLFDFHHPY